MPSSPGNRGVGANIFFPQPGVYLSMIDTGLIAQELRDRGHAVGHITPVSANAGDWEFQVDGNLLSLIEVRALLESEQGDTPRS